MAQPNVVNVSSIFGETVATSLSSTAATTVLGNTTGSNQLYKINTILVANDDGTNDAAITLTYNSSGSGGGTAYKIANTITVPADATLVVIDKNSAIYLEEDRSIVATASAANDLDVIISYEQIDDA